MKKTITNDNRGFSLLELIVAVLILGIISATAITSFRSIFNARSEAAAEVAASVLKQTRSKTMSLTDNALTETYAKFYVKGSDYYVDLIRVESDTDPATPDNVQVLVTKMLGNDGLTLTFRSHSNTSISNTVTSTNDVKVYFKRNTGGIARIEAGSSDDSKLDELLITGSGGDKKVIIVRGTGRCYNAD